MDIYDITYKIRKDSVRVGNIDYYPVEKIVNMLEGLHNTCIQWCTDDFASRAKEKAGDDWNQYYDEEKFPAALEDMIRHHDAEYGICWSTIDYYLDTFCKIKDKIYTDLK